MTENTTEHIKDEGSNWPTRYWHKIEDGRIQCDLCPRDCKLHEGQRGACFVRKNVGDQIVGKTGLGVRKMRPGEGHGVRGQGQRVGRRWKERLKQV